MRENCGKSVSFIFPPKIFISTILSHLQPLRNLQFDIQPAEEGPSIRAETSVKKESIQLQVSEWLEMRENCGNDCPSKNIIQNFYCTPSSTIKMKKN